MWDEFCARPGSSGPRFAKLARLGIPFFAGVVAPILLFLVPYAISGSLGDLYQGLIVLPRERLTFAYQALPPFDTAIAALPYALVLAFPLLRDALRLAAGYGRRDSVEPSESQRTSAPALWQWMLAGVVALVLGVLLISIREAPPQGSGQPVFVWAWYSVRPLVPVVVLIGCVMLGARQSWSSALPATRRQELLLMVAMAAMTSLVQYPWSFGLYFCYAAPLVVLAVVHVVRAQRDPPILLHFCYLIFAAAWLNTCYIRTLDIAHARVAQDYLLDFDRGGIEVDGRTGPIYDALVREIRRHVPDLPARTPRRCTSYLECGTRRGCSTSSSTRARPQGSVS
jgi:hypothetical protein